MREVVLYIARPDGDVDWLHAPEYAIPGEDYGYQAFYGAVDTVFMGNKIYQQIGSSTVRLPAVNFNSNPGSRLLPASCN